MVNKVPRHIFLNTLYNYIGTVPISILSFFILIYLTKNLSLEDFGKYSVILSSQALFVLLLSCGLPSIILRYIPEYLTKGRYNLAKKMILNSSLIILILGVVITSCLALISKKHAPLIDKFFVAEYLLLASLLGLCKAEVRIFESAFYAFLRQGYKISVEASGLLIKCILFIFSIEKGFGLRGVILSIGLVDFILTIAYFLRIKHYTNSLKDEGRGAGDAPLEKKRIVVYGTKEYLTKLSAFFWDNKIDAYFITYYLGFGATGLFCFAMNMISTLAEYMPGSLLQSMGQVIFTRQYAKNEDKKEIGYLFQLNNKLVIFTVLPVFISFVLLSDKIVWLFFSKYIGSLFLFPIITFFMLFYVLLLPVRSVITAIEKSEITLMSNIVILYKIPMTIFLTKKFGLQGTAFSVGTSFLLFFIIQLLLTKRHIRIGYPWASIFKISINSIAAGLVILLLKPLVNNIFSFSFILIIFLILYLAMSFINSAFSEYDRQIINKPFRKPLWRF